VDVWTSQGISPAASQSWIVYPPFVGRNDSSRLIVGRTTSSPVAQDRREELNKRFCIEDKPPDREQTSILLCSKVLLRDHIIDTAKEDIKKFKLLMLSVNRISRQKWRVLRWKRRVLDLVGDVVLGPIFRSCCGVVTVVCGQLY